MGQKTPEIRAMIIREAMKGCNYRDLSAKYDISISGISQMVKKYNKTGIVSRTPGSGRKKITTQHTDRAIHRYVRANPSTSIRMVKEELTLDNISDRTIRRRIDERGLRSFFKMRKPLLRAANVKKRLLFAKKYVNMPISFWKRVIWTDESKFELKNCKRRKRVWCKSNERLQSKFTQATVKHGGGSLMVWGCFSHKGVGRLVKIDGIMTGESYVDLLKQNFGPSTRKIGINRYIFQQDNDPKHTSRVAKVYFGSKNWEILEWPPQSPDLNPIEHLWTILDDRTPMTSRTSIQKMWDGMKEAWDAIPSKILANLVESMPARLRMVIKNKGGHTSY